jgi:hypothetical protein
MILILTFNDTSISGAMIFACIMHHAKRIGEAHRLELEINNSVASWREYTLMNNFIQCATDDRLNSGNIR